MTTPALSDGSAASRNLPVHYRPSRAWAMATPIIALIVVLGIPFAYMTITWTEKMAAAPGRFTDAVTQIASQAVQPKINVTEEVINTLAEIRKTNKLVVAEPVINVDVTVEESYSSWGVYWGTNVARVLARGVKTQFYVDMSKLGSSDFQYDEQAHRLTVYIPAPRLDTQMIAVDPAKIQTLALGGGWSRFDKQSTWQHAINDIVPSTITQANTPLTQKVAREAGLSALTDIFHPLAREMARDGVDVRVVYTE